MPTPNGSLPRVALIGVSGYGGIYLQLLREALHKKTVVLVAAVIINHRDVPDIVAELKAGGTTIYSDTAAFFAAESGKIDLCLIPVAIQWHARLTISALHAGMNVLVEKPLAGSLADIAAIRKAETESRRWVAVGFQDIYSIESRWLKTQLLAGVIGKLESIRMIGLWPRNRSYFSRNHWAGRIEADGAAVLDSPLNNAFAHFVNLPLYLAGSTMDESASVTLRTAELHRAHQIETFDTAIVEGATPAGVRLWFGVSHVSSSIREPEIYLRGSKGHAEWWHEQRCVVVDDAGRRQVFPLPSSEDSRRLMFTAVLDRLSHPATFVCSTAMAEQHTRLIEAVRHSGPVHPFPASAITWLTDQDGRSERPCVHDLDEAMDEALRLGNPALRLAPSCEPLGQPL
jgi:predicted dehydrogenase